MKLKEMGMQGQQEMTDMSGGPVDNALALIDKIKQERAQSPEGMPASVLYDIIDKLEDILSRP